MFIPRSAPLKTIALRSRGVWVGTSGKVPGAEFVFQLVNPPNSGFTKVHRSTRVYLQGPSYDSSSQMGCQLKLVAGE